MLNHMHKKRKRKEILHDIHTRMNPRKQVWQVCLHTAWGKTGNGNKTDTVYSQHFHDNNKLMELTSHILFMLFDRVVGSLHRREILERIHVWMKEAPSFKSLQEACFHPSHLNVNKRYLFLSSPGPQHSTRQTSIMTHKITDAIQWNAKFLFCCKNMYLWYLWK